MHIKDQAEDYFLIEISSPIGSAQILFSWARRDLIFLDTTPISELLRENEYQLRKIFHNKRPETFYVGFKLKIILRRDKDVTSFNDLANIIVLDKLNENTKIYVLFSSNLILPEIYTDGCFLDKYKVGGLASLICYPQGYKRLFTGGTYRRSSSLIELMAAIMALKKIENHQKIRIFTDSRYVIKGLTEWLTNWKLNDWHTAQGTKVKNIAYWKEFDHLTENKYIEFKWVKAHFESVENKIVDFYAKQAALRFFVEN